MSNLQTYYHFKLDFQKVDQHTGGKWLIQSTIVVILLTGPLETNFSEFLIKICIFSFKKMHLKTSAKWRPFVSASMC